MTRGEKFVDRNSAGAPAKRLQSLDCFVDLFLPALPLRHEPRDGTATSCNYHRFAALDLIEDLKQAGSGVRGLDFAHTLKIAGNVLFGSGMVPAKSTL